ncbi:MAG TPA: hypothetical protein VGE84_06470 [Allosphingosinicella sp.]
MNDDHRPSEPASPDHDHGDKTEQEARIEGAHGWGYGGEPQDEVEVTRQDRGAERARDGNGPTSEQGEATGPEESARSGNGETE